METASGLQSLQDKYAIASITAENLYEIHYQGTDHDNRNVCIKVYKAKNLKPSEWLLFKHEYDLIKSLDFNGVVRVFDIADHNGMPTVIHESVEGISLKDIIQNERIDLNRFLSIAMDLASSLGVLHASEIIHRDIRPANIIVAGTGTKLIDFGISVIFNRIIEKIYIPAVVDEILPFISPEMTGRINRTVDYRSDLYSLGLTLYEMLTGTNPLKIGDPREIIYFHLARTPDPPHVINSAVPEVLSDIVMKLIAKNPEDRYQNGFGLHADIMKCINGLDSRGRIEPFEIAAEDISIRFIIPQVLVGREKELGTLLAAFKKAGSYSRSSLSKSDDGGVELALVHGHPGIGKSTLIHELSRAVVERKGYFISGKHEELRKNIPYSSIIQAFQMLIRELLSESEDRIERWRVSLRDMLRENGRVITDVIPEVELIIGKQPDILELGPEAAKNRLRLVFLDFIKAFALVEHPLVLLIDDLQWADFATINLIKSILEDKQIHYLLVILSYRDNEPEKHLILNEVLNYIERLDISVSSIQLDPFSLEDTVRYTSFFLRRNVSESKALGELVYEKTRGNPFFINQFMKSIYDMQVLAYEPTSGWKYDFEAIKQMQVTSNVRDLMIQRIVTLPDETLKVLQICSCMGNRFELEIVAEAAGMTLDSVLAEMRAVINEGFVSIIDSTFRFAHDRIVEMLYSLISTEERMKTHYAIGMLLLQKTREEDLEDAIILIVNQLNAGISCISTEDERYRIAKLNQIAANKAMASAAYQSAYMYIKTAISICGSDCWEKDYDMALSLYTKGAEAAFLVTEFAYMEMLAKIVLEKAKTLLDKIVIYELNIQMYYAQNRLQEGLREGFHALKLLGRPLPDNPTKVHVLLALIKTRFLLKWKRIEDLQQIKEMDDPYVLAFMYIINNLGVAIYKTYPRILPSLLFKAIELSLKHGNAPETAMSFAAYGMILCGILGDIDGGYAYGQLALTLKERPSGRKHKARTLHLVKSMIWHWKNHIRETLDPLIEAYHLELEIGDIEQATSSANLFCLYTYLSGMPLDMVRQKMEYYYKVIRQFKQVTNFNYLAISYQAVLNLADGSIDQSCIRGDVYNEEEMLSVHGAANDKTALALLSIHKLINNYLFHNINESRVHAEEARKYLEGLLGVFIIPVFYFYDSLSRLAACESAPRGQRKRHLAHLRKNQRKMLKWAGHAPMNHLHKYDLVEAERWRITGNPAQAMRYYTKAIAEAHDNQFIQEEALANELASRFYLDQGQTMVARLYINEAVRLYTEWNATAKVGQVYAAYSELFPVVSADEFKLDASLKERDLAAPRMDIDGFQSLDLSMVINALQAISQEIELEKLIEGIMRLAIENAGARRGILIINRDEDFYIEAEGLIDETLRIILHPEQLKNFKGIPQSIINYVRRTGKAVALHNAIHEGEYMHDPYVREHESHSILCVPLIRQQVMKGIIYLENNTTSGVFSPERIQIVKLFSTQAAISLENAILFEKKHQAEKVLRESEEKFRLLIETMNDGVGVIDNNGVFTYINNTFCEMLKYSSEELIGKRLHAFLDDQNRIIHEKQMELRRKGINRSYEIDWTRKDGKLLSTIVSPRSMYDVEGRFMGSFGVISDITERKKLQEHLLQFQKMEAVGTLAGGIAHDFNNLLTTIIGYCGLLQKRMDPGDMQYDIVNEINKAANRSASLTRQLLAFSRKQLLQPVSLDLNIVITNMEKMLLRLIGEDITLHTDLDPGIKKIKADPGQLEQVIMNLVVNARDAMPSGGELTIKTENVRKAGGIGEYPGGVFVTEYTSCVFTDNGIGMDETIIKQIFEPFFTTKETGVGTGLGLSVVYGIINQHKGWIDVASEPGTGTTFKIYLPVFVSETEEMIEDNTKKTAAADYQGNRERILLVEDQDDVRKFIITALKENNYTMFPAANSLEALEIFKQEDGRFHLVISDVVLPDISGLQLVEKLLMLKPDLAVILSSGYSDKKSEWERIHEKGYVFLQKPYTVEKLLITIRDVLQNNKN